MAFARCTGLKTLTLSVSDELGYGAFLGCTNLTTTNINEIPSSITSIYPSFQDCTGKLTINVTSLPTSLTTDHAPFNKADFNAVTTNKSASYMFYGCRNLQKLTLNNPTSWNGYTLYGSSVSSLALINADSKYKISSDGKYIYYDNSGQRNICLVVNTSLLPLEEVGKKYNFNSNSLASFEGYLDLSKLTTTPNFAETERQAYCICTPSMASDCQTTFGINHCVIKEDAGDVNNDGKVSISDVNALIDYLKKK